MGSSDRANLFMVPQATAFLAELPTNSEHRATCFTFTHAGFTHSLNRRVEQKGPQQPSASPPKTPTPRCRRLPSDSMDPMTGTRRTWLSSACPATSPRRRRAAESTEDRRGVWDVFGIGSLECCVSRSTDRTNTQRNTWEAVKE